jgi:hypothetical protein
MDIVQMVLAGKINKGACFIDKQGRRQSSQHLRIDGGCSKARKLTENGFDYGLWRDLRIDQNLFTLALELVTYLSYPHRGRICRKYS